MARPFIKTLIVIRHAHRDKDQGREVDNGLSEKGWAQAEKLFRHFEHRYGGIPVRVVSSSRLRCIETVQAIADQKKKKIEVDDILLEQIEKESGKAFRARVRSFMRGWTKSKDAVTLISTHGDWIPFFFEEALGIEVNLKKGGWAEIEFSGKHAELTWLIQEL